MQSAPSSTKPRRDAERTVTGYVNPIGIPVWRSRIAAREASASVNLTSRRLMLPRSARWLATGGGAE